MVSNVNETGEFTLIHGGKCPPSGLVGRRVTQWIVSRMSRDNSPATANSTRIGWRRRSGIGWRRRSDMEVWDVELPPAAIDLQIVDNECQTGAQTVTLPNLLGIKGGWKGIQLVQSIGVVGQSLTTPAMSIFMRTHRECPISTKLGTILHGNLFHGVQTIDMDHPVLIVW